MFFEDTNFDCALNDEKSTVFDVINKVMKDEPKKEKKNLDRHHRIDSRSYQPISQPMNAQSNQPFNQQQFNQDYNPDLNPDFNSVLQSKFGLLDSTKSNNHNMNSKDYSSLFQPNGYFNDKNNNLTDKFVDQSPSDHHVKNAIINHSLSNLSSPSTISSPNANGYLNFFTFQPPFNHLSTQTHPPFNTTLKTRSGGLTNKQTSLTDHKTSNNQRIWHERPIPDKHTLHPELWAIIFRFLNIKDKGRVARTCVFFRDVVYSKSVWKGEIARLHLKKRYSIVLESLTRRGIKSIQVRFVWFFFNFVFSCLLYTIQWTFLIAGDLWALLTDLCVSTLILYIINFVD